MNLRRFAGVAGLIAVAVAGPALAQKPGGVLRVAHRDSPASMSTLEEVTISTVVGVPSPERAARKKMRR
jgi:peptide/nickel transport system substrate-binding protein